MRQKRNYGLLLFFSAVLLVIGIWIYRIVSGSVLYIDTATRGLVEALSGTATFTIFRWITELGSGEFLTPFTIIMSLVMWYVFRDWLPGLVLGLGTWSTHGLNIMIKQIVERERPSIFIAANAEGYSFPSGHAMIPMVCYGLLAYFAAKKLLSNKSALTVQVSLALLVFLIGISRYIINVHYLSDVIAGFVFGFIYLMVLIYLYNWVQALKGPTGKTSA
ncbi:undecaprenyl-diphosphatase [Lentibacillus persicus]|uniref:Undecaprenyl-diphosphatase n=1 Tax=Lentibacillus persicus TaxID=640948 RepID=A0A1I1RRP9_9BACI|nr:phosphatase PAP2 family protein [Lentibacillus persicus]SFD37039.1 undecaprenyl-diphosphatase [Lentibacillus persicus]